MIPKCNYSKKELNLILSCAEFSMEKLKDIAADKIKAQDLSAMTTILTIDSVAQLVAKTKLLINGA